jgi:hypothetical protein
VLALPLEYLHDHFRLPRTNFLSAFSGGDADLEPDLDPGRSLPLCDIKVIKRLLSAIPGELKLRLPRFSVAIPALFRCLHGAFPGAISPGAAAP